MGVHNRFKAYKAACEAVIAKGGLRDGFGRKPPGYLEEIFAGARRMDLLLLELWRFRTELGIMTEEPYGRSLDIKRLNALFREIGVVVSRARPMVSCDCEPWVRDCPKCEGTRWRCAGDLVGGGLRP